MQRAKELLQQTAKRRPQPLTEDRRLTLEAARRRRKKRQGVAA